MLLHVQHRAERPHHDLAPLLSVASQNFRLAETRVESAQHQQVVFLRQRPQRRHRQLADLLPRMLRRQDRAKRGIRLNMAIKRLVVHR